MLGGVGASAVLTIGVLCELVADILCKLWANKNAPIFLAVGITIYCISGLIWALSLRFETLSRAVVFFTVGNLLAAVMAGVLVFGESLSWPQRMGLLLGLVSIILIQL